jgi:hypothetical protein
MNFKKTVYVCLILSLLTAGYSFGFTTNQTTARSLVRILPYADRDPFKIESPPIDEHMQKTFRGSIAILIKRDRMLEKLLDRDIVQQTKWFEAFAKTKDDRFKAALKDLQKNFKAELIENTDLMEISMAGQPIKEAALIVDEMIELFITELQINNKTQILARLINIRNQKEKVQQELMNSEKWLDEIRISTKFIDLQRHDYSDAAGARMIHLQTQADDIRLEMAAFQSYLTIPNQKVAEIDKAKGDLAALTEQLKTAENLFKESKAHKAEFDLARVRYEIAIDARDQKRHRVGRIDELIGKLIILADDPQISKLQIIESAGDGIDVEP